jgi:GDP-4-dehydro-6-deoxy-D-mannose reductase
LIIKIKYHALDLLAAESVQSIIKLEKPDAVIHLAALSSVGQSWNNPDQFINENVQLTENILKAVSSCENTCAFLFVSSAEVYKASAMPLKEDDELEAKNPYAASKIKCEQFVQTYCTEHNIKYYIARPFNHIGVGQSPNFVLPSFAQQIAHIAQSPTKSGTLSTGNLDVVRDFSAVQDVVAAYWQILQNGQSGSIYNICSSQPTPLRQIISTLEHLAKVELNLSTDPAKIRPNDNLYIVGDCTKLMSDTPWKPQVPLNTVLQQILESYLY